MPRLHALCFQFILCIMSTVGILSIVVLWWDVIVSANNSALDHYTAVFHIVAIRGFLDGFLIYAVGLYAVEPW